MFLPPSSVYWKPGPVDLPWAPSTLLCKCGFHSWKEAKEQGGYVAGVRSLGYAAMRKAWSGLCAIGDDTYVDTLAIGSGGRTVPHLVTQPPASPAGRRR